MRDCDSLRETQSGICEAVGGRSAETLPPLARPDRQANYLQAVTRRRDGDSDLTMRDCGSPRKREEGITEAARGRPAVTIETLPHAQTDRRTGYSGDGGERPARWIAEDAGNVSGKGR